MNDFDNNEFKQKKKIDTSCYIDIGLLNKVDKDILKACDEIYIIDYDNSKIEKNNQEPLAKNIDEVPHKDVNLVDTDKLTNDEINFLNKKGIAIESLRSRWDWVYKYPNLTLDFFKEILYPRFNRVPTQLEIFDMGYRGFYNAINNIGQSYTDLVNKAGQKPNWDAKYADLSFQALVELFKNKIYPDLKKKYALEEGVPPLYDQIELNYRGFLNRLCNKLGKSLNDLFKAVNLVPRRENKYNNFSFEQFVSFFNNVIYPFLKKKYSLTLNEAPTGYQINAYFSGFLRALYKKKYSINEIYKQLGLDINYEFSYRGKSYEELKFMFVNQIYPDLNEKYDLDDLLPSYQELQSVYPGFINALKKFNKTYNELLLDLNLEPRILKESLIGRLLHNVLSLFISKNINIIFHKYRFYTESKLFIGSGLTVDGFIEIDNFFLTEFNSNFNKFCNNYNNKTFTDFLKNLGIKINKMNYLIFDYSNAFILSDSTLNYSLIIRKILKYNRSINPFLFLVGTNWTTSDLFIPLPSEIEYNNRIVSTENVMLISPLLFSIIIGLNYDQIKSFETILQYNIKKDENSLQTILNSLNQENIELLSKTDLVTFDGNFNLDNWI